jgi:DNA polymerase-3 subunit beta
VETPGAITIPAKKLSEIARELPPAPVKIGAVGEQRITLECGRSKFKLLGLPRDEFPTFPQVRFQDSWRVRSGDLQKLISHTSFAVSTEESRPILNGVLWALRADRMRMVATNGHRLTRMDLPTTSGNSPGGDLIIPPKALDQVRRLFPAEEELEIAQGDNHLGFRSPFTSVFTRLIEGPYPNYEQVIPRDNDRVAISDKIALISALKRMSVVRRIKRTEYIFHSTLLCYGFVFKPQILATQDELPIRFTGDPIDIGFNANYLLEILRCIQLMKSGSMAPTRGDNWACGRIQPRTCVW